MNHHDGLKSSEGFMRGVGFRDKEEDKWLDGGCNLLFYGIDSITLDGIPIFLWKNKPIGIDKYECRKQLINMNNIKLQVSLKLNS